MRFFLQILVILAIVTAGISPACAFISGQASLVEICTSKGIEYKSLPGAPASDEHHEKKQSDCGFCFNTAHGKSLKSDPVVISIFAPAFEPNLSPALYSVSQTGFYNPHAPRAPPAFL